MNVSAPTNYHLTYEKDLMKVSLVTVTYQAASTLEDTIKSVLMQDHADIEYIIVDGGSKDNTIEILKHYEKDFNGRMRWISEPDNGLYDAMNKGIKMSSGDIVGIINADDFYHHTNSISMVVEQFEDSDVDAVYGDVVFVRPNNLNKVARYYSSRNFTLSKFRFGFMPAHPTFFTKKAFFEKFGYYKTDYGISADYELLIRFLYSHKLRTKYIPMALLTMRMGGKSSASIYSHFLLTYECIRAAKSNGIYTNMFLLMLKYPIKILEYLR